MSELHIIRYLHHSLGEPELDQIITVLLRTNMLVGGITGLLLDNTIPGSREERGMLVWNNKAGGTGHSGNHVYDLPFGLKKLSFYKCTKYVPFLPYYESEEVPSVELKEVSQKHVDLPAV